MDRRGFLGALVLGPAALAGCAAARTASAGGTASASAGREAPDEAADAALAAVRAFPIDPEAEPAFVFRAAAARPGEA